MQGGDFDLWRRAAVVECLEEAFVNAGFYGVQECMKNEFMGAARQIVRGWATAEIHAGARPRRWNSAQKRILDTLHEAYGLRATKAQATSLGYTWNEAIRA